jgi:hypothetical protein
LRDRQRIDSQRVPEKLPCVNGRNWPKAVGQRAARIRSAEKDLNRQLASSLPFQMVDRRTRPHHGSCRGARNASVPFRARVWYGIEGHVPVEAMNVWR